MLNKKSETEEFRKVPPNFLTIEQYWEVLQSNQREHKQSKLNIEQELASEYENTIKFANNKYKAERENNILEENEQNLKTQRKIEYDNFNKRKQMLERNTEMNQIHDLIKKKKMKEIDDKKNDNSNFELTQKLIHDRIKLNAEIQLSDAKAKNDYRKDLEMQEIYNRQTKSNFNKTHRNSLAETDGFEFECYTRDKLINQEKIKTRDYNKEQRVNDIWRKVADKEELIKPPPFLIEKIFKTKQSLG